MISLKSVTSITLAFFMIAFSTISFAGGHKASEKKDIVDTAVAAGSFKTLVTAVKAAGLVDTLKSKGPFTVFAPTDEAFAKLPKDLIATLLKPENKATLAKILTYHVIPGKVLSSDIKGKTLKVKTVEGSEASVDATKDVMIDSAKVIKADIKTSNGVIHVINAVILPPEVRGSLSEKRGSSKKETRGSN